MNETQSSQGEREVISVDRLKGLSQELLKELLVSVTGDKLLILSDDIKDKVCYMIPHSMIQKCGVKSTYKLENKDLKTNLPNVVYIVGANVDNMKIISKQIKYIQQQQSEVHQNFYIFMVPRINSVCTKELKTRGVSVGKDVTVSSFSLDILPYEHDLFTLEYPFCYRDCQLFGDFTTLSNVAHALTKFQGQVGLIPHIQAKGVHSVTVGKMMSRLCQKKLIDMKIVKPPTIDKIIFIDRSLDLMSPFLSQLTYEGLIDEFIQINNGTISPPFLPKIKTKDGKMTNRKMGLNSSDTVYKLIRDLNQKFCGGVLRVKSKEIEKVINERKELDTVSKLKIYIKSKLQKIQEEKKKLEIHLQVLERIQKILRLPDFGRSIRNQQSILQGGDKETYEYIQECIYRKDPITKVLRFLCLISFVCGGVNKKKYSAIKTELMQTYGFEISLTLSNLEKAGLLVSKTKREISWNSIKKTFQLIDERGQKTDKSKEEKYNVHQAFDGIAPLSVQIIRKLSHNWQTHSKLSGPAFEHYYEDLPFVDLKKDKKICLVFFVGGTTFTEINTIRYLNKTRSEMDYQYIIGTTKLINGRTFLLSMFEDVGLIMKKEKEMVKNSNYSIKN